MKYRVIVSVLALKNNVMAKYGDEVTEEQLTDSAERLVNGKYIEVVGAPQPSAADLQKMADEAKEKEIDGAKMAVGQAASVLENAKTVAAGAAPELKDAADAAVAKATEDLNTAQAALDALTAPAKADKKK